MAELRLVPDQAGAPAALAPLRLPPGRHGLPDDVVRAHQRHRMLEAAAAALDEQGYGRLTTARLTELAGVSSRTFYQHFEDLWACVLAAYEVEAARLCGAIEGACAAAGADRRARARTGIATALSFLAAEPGVARLLSSEPPPQIAPLAAARQQLVERLGGMLRKILEPGAATPLPGLERRLVGASMALVAARAASGEPRRLRELEPELSEILLASL